ncbi:selenocysteine-specific translation elongation factor [Nitratifractor sp.]
MKHLIVGTAGHVDHGKTALIRAMTGYDGDKLAEEKERGITIDLSFSNLRRGERNIAFIDVPGHDRLVKTMVGGAFGFDAALLAVAADDGIMPQTLEHLQVLRFVGVERIVVAITKSDLADAERIESLREEIGAWMREKFPSLKVEAILPVSIRDPRSVEALEETLFALPLRSGEEGEFFRYYVDRVFSPRGAGTVVTGTVLSGSVGAGEKIQVAELGKTAQVKGIQIHGESVERATTHQRAALNLSLPHRELERGMLLCSKGYFRGFDRLELSIESLGEEAIPHGAEVLFVTGSKRVEGRLLYYAGEEFATLRLSERVFARFGDPYILLFRGRVAAGGEILMPVADPLRKSQKLLLLRALKERDLLLAFTLLTRWHPRGFGLVASQQRFALSHAEALEIAREAADRLPGAFLDERGLVLYSPEATERVLEALRSLYGANPRALLSPASLSLRMKWASEALIASAMERLEAEGFLHRHEGLYLRADQSAEELLRGVEERILKILEAEGTTPEAPNNLYERLDLDRRRGDRALKALTRAKKVVRLDHNLFVTDANLRRALEQMETIMKEEGFIDIRNFKARSGMSRKYCIAYLEYLDRFGKVRREGEKRVSV